MIKERKKERKNKDAWRLMVYLLKKAGRVYTWHLAVLLSLEFGPFTVVIVL